MFLGSNGFPYFKDNIRLLYVSAYHTHHMK